ncbi:MAG TPA: MFS transporter [Bryobacteraceae bacterium]|nr:MFS transporter [Bryobacteraceae bacterium]
MLSGFARPPFWRVVGCVFIGMLAFGAMIPLLPLYLRDQLHSTPFVIGIVIGLSSAFAVLGRLLAGPTADARTRKFTFAVGISLCACAGILYLPVFGLMGVIVGRVFHGAGEAFFMTAAVTWIVDLAPAQERAQALGYFASGVWGGLSLGPLAGQMFGAWQTAAFFVTASSAIVLLVLWRTPEAPPHGLERHNKGHRHAPAPIKLNIPKEVWVPGFVLGFAAVSYAAMAGFLVLLLRERGPGGTYAFASFALCVLFIRTLLGSLPDRLGPRKTLFLGLSMLVAGLLLIAITRDPSVATMASALVGLGYSFPWPSLAVVVVRSVRDKERASALGALNAFFDLFVSLGALAAGALAGKFGYASVFWMAAGSGTCAALVAWATGVGRDPKPLGELELEEVGV